MTKCFLRNDLYIFLVISICFLILGILFIVPFDKNILAIINMRLATVSVAFLMVFIFGFNFFNGKNNPYVVIHNHTVVINTGPLGKQHVFETSEIDGVHSIKGKILEVSYTTNNSAKLAKIYLQVLDSDPKAEIVNFFNNYCSDEES